MSSFSGQYTFKSPEFDKFFAADHILNFINYKLEHINNLTEKE